MADYHRQFEKTTRQPEEDPSIFVIALETLAVKAFGDMGHTAQLCIIWDRFIAGHLDSVALEIAIQDIVARCRVWESHADSDNRRGSRPGPERALPIFMADDVGGGRDDQTVADLEQLLQQLQNLILVSPSPDSRTEQGPGCRDWATMLCFSCGKTGHGGDPMSCAGCVISLLAAGMEGGKGACGSGASPGSVAGREMATDPVRGLRRPD